MKLGLSARKDQNIVDSALNLALAASITVAGGAFAYAVLTPHPGETFTEFYLLGSDGEASGYPMALNLSETAMVILGIVSHESTRVDFTLRIDLVGVRVIYNTTSASNETVEVNRTNWSVLNVSLLPGANWTYNYTFSISFGGIWKVQFLLFRSSDADSAYRELHLFIRVG